jgi:hypothetical protein
VLREILASGRLGFAGASRAGIARRGVPDPRMKDV